MLFLLYFEHSGKLFFRGRFVLQEISLRLNSGEHFVLRIIKLRNCEVYYMLPENWISKVKMSQCKVFVKGENLMTLSNLKAMDPENIGTNFPTLMGVNLGVSVKF